MALFVPSAYKLKLHGAIRFFHNQLFLKYLETIFKLATLNDKFLMMVSTMCLHIKVAWINTPSDGKGITVVIPFFNEMENKKIKFMKRCCQEHCHRSPVTVTLSLVESLLTSQSWPAGQSLIHIAAGAQSCRKMFVFTKILCQKISKSGSESESSIHCCHAAVQKWWNVKELCNPLEENGTNQSDLREWRQIWRNNLWTS